MADHHSHDHGHSHGHTHSHPAPGSTLDSIAQANKVHFDATAKKAVDPKWVEMAKRIGTAIRQHYAFDEDKTVLMDFACNIGLTSRELAPYTKTLVGVDISQGSVDAFNEAVANQGLAPEEMRAVCVELKGEEGELDGMRFDAITCALSYHHFSDFASITKTLAFFLKPGGALLVADIMKPEDAGDAPLFDDKYTHVVPHAHGMSREALQAAVDGAGLADFAFTRISNVNMHGMDAVLFIAKGVKPTV